jgi:hypothetical protein
VAATKIQLAVLEDIPNLTPVTPLESVHDNVLALPMTTRMKYSRRPGKDRKTNGFFHHTPQKEKKREKNGN